MKASIVEYIIAFALVIILIFAAWTFFNKDKYYSKDAHELVEVIQTKVKEEQVRSGKFLRTEYVCDVHAKEKDSLKIFTYRSEDSLKTKAICDAFQTQKQYEITYNQNDNHIRDYKKL
ncbi:hypothetical protein [Bacillus thuringiensis]|uniref:Uncharacterized protein n=1 Tax=Bacillus thuringiensis TaxID=1428 RepID=A0A9X6ZS63_BACTU|nr:hypothetical protein [Bacillus thuringiensis]PFJ36704.1 hypothetical protein COJ15_22460 [Bacillus thuringiensis]